MKKIYSIKLVIWLVLFGISKLSIAQMRHSEMVISSKAKVKRELIKFDLRSKINGIQKRDGANPSICAVDTSEYSDVGSSLNYRLVNLGDNQDVGIFFNAPQEITLNGFRFFAFLPWDSVLQSTTVDVWCKVYEAGVDSLPMGNPIDSVKINIDTIQGNLDFVNTKKDIVFSSPLTIDHNYVITIENKATGSAVPNIISNNWNTADGLGLNLSKVRLNNRWYHSRDINIDGITFDANFIIFPFVKYNLIAEFKGLDKCYDYKDSLRFENLYSKSVVSSPFYNEYVHYESTGYGSWCHSWYFNDTTNFPDVIDAVYKPNAKFNINAKLLSYLVPYSRNVDLCYDSSEKIIYFQPDAAQLLDSNGCIGAKETLELDNNSEVKFEWFTDSTQVNSVHSGSELIVNQFDKELTFYVDAFNTEDAKCKVEKSPIRFKLTQYPDTLTLTSSNLSVCTGAFAILEGKSNNGTIWWYDNETATTPVAKGDVFETPALNANANYYAEANNLGCAMKAAREKIDITVSSGFAPAVPSISGNQSKCVPEFQSAQVTLTATPASGSSLRWYSSPVSSNVVSTQSNYTVDLYGRGDVYVYVQSWNGACGSSKLPVKVRGNRSPELLAAQAEDGCFGDSLKLSGFGNWGELDWYLDTNSAPVVSGNFVSMKLADSGARTVYIKVREGQCVNDSFYRLKVIVKPTVLPNSIVTEKVCRGSEASIALKGLNKETSILWYETGNATEVISGDSILNLGRIFSNTTRYMETVYRGCRSERKPITVDVLDQPVAGFRVTYPTVQSIALEPINTRNMTIDWSFGDGNTSSDLQPTHTYSAAGKYQVRMIANSTLSKCADTSQAEVSVTLNSIDMVERNLAVFPNPVLAGSLLHLQLSTSEPIQHVRVMDLGGRLVYEIMNVNRNTILLPASLSEGIYTVAAEAGDKTYSQLIQVSN